MTLPFGYGILFTKMGKHLSATIGCNSMYLPYDTGFGFACCICGGENSVGGSAHKKKEEVQQIKYTKPDTLPETAERKEDDEKAA